MVNGGRRYVTLVLGLLLLCVSLLGTIPVDASPQAHEEPLVIYFFWGDGCPHCEEAKPFLKGLAARYPNVVVEDYEVWYNAENQERFEEMAASQGVEVRGVPAFFIGDRYFVGFNEQIGEQIESHVVALLDEEAGEGGEEAETSVIRVPFVGAINLGEHSLWISTAIIGFVDGFNPCSLWVLSVLIALTLHTGSRKRIFTIGLIYITVTAGVYVLFIAGLFTMLTVVKFLGWIQAAVSVLALFFALVNIKDYFWYKEGLSFTIADEKKPGIYKRMRKVMNAGDSLWSLVAATVALAVGVSLVEFSCTAGFPVLWTNLVAAQNVTTGTFVGLLLLYMLIYQIDELVIFLAAVFTLRASKLEEKHGRILKLVGGTVMLALAGVMLFEPSVMNNLTSTLLIFGGAFLLAIAILVVHRYVLPYFDIYIGSEMKRPRRHKRRRQRKSS